jgi:hypothetical protein
MDPHCTAFLAGKELPLIAIAILHLNPYNVSNNTKSFGDLSALGVQVFLFKAPARAQRETQIVTERRRHEL